jgi:hypothetical protein
MLDTNGEVKGKLASFFFDLQGGAAGAPRRKHETTPGGYWDSDALLMSLNTDIDLDEEEEEGPEGPRADYVHNPIDFETNGTPELTSGTGAEYLGVKPPVSPRLEATSPVLGRDGWFRVLHGVGVETPDDRTLTALARQEEEERRKFEWLVPEHLPNSPLCPLHPKYRGPSKELCYWHGRRSGNKIKGGEYNQGQGSRSGNGGGQGGGAYIGDIRQAGTSTRKVKKRRLASLSSP